MVWRIVGTLVGLGLIIIGVPLMISPIPFGIVLIIIGLLVLVAANPLAAKALRALRRRHPWLDEFLRKAENLLPPDAAAPLRDTDGRRDDDDEAAAPTPRLRYGPPMRKDPARQRLH